MDQPRDIECGTDLPHSAQLDREDPANEPSEAAVQELLRELNAFLHQHYQKIHSLGKPPPGSVGPHQASSHTPNPRPKIDIPEQGISEKKLTRQLPTIEPLTSSPVEMDTVEMYKDHLGVFLQSHMSNVKSLLHNLKPSLPPKSSLPPYRTIDGEKPPRSGFLPSTSPSMGPEALEALTEQFNMLVVISTFTASLIVSFIQLVKDVMEAENRLAFDVGMFLSFLAMGVHFGNIIVAGRGAALTSQHGALTEGEGKYDTKYFNHYLELCEQLQFAATILFISSIILLSFFIFSKLTYPIVLLGICSLWAGLVFWSVYWKVSITVRDLKFLARWAKKCWRLFSDRPR